MTELLCEFVNCTPLEILARTIVAFDAFDAAPSIYGAYDSFLAILGDMDQRKHLETLTVDTAFADPLFLETREIGKRFQGGLSKLFFETNQELTEATQRYGVF